MFDPAPLPANREGRLTPEQARHLRRDVLYSRLAAGVCCACVPVFLVGMHAHFALVIGSGLVLVPAWYRLVIEQVQGGRGASPPQRPPS